MQETLQRGVALLHSFWFIEGEKAFRAVLAQDSACAIAHWGIAAALMGNPLGGLGPSPQWAQRAQAATTAREALAGFAPREDPMGLSLAAERCRGVPLRLLRRT